MTYGIPQFRLPREVVDAQIAHLERKGVKVKCNVPIGQISSIRELLADGGFDAVFVGSGLSRPAFLNIKGESAEGVYSANEYLARIHLREEFRDPSSALKAPKKVAILGGGNVAMDCARTALRMGAEAVHLVYRRTADQMPARKVELEHALREGIVVDELRNPVEILQSDNKVSGLLLDRMVLGSPDASGRRQPQPSGEAPVTVDFEEVVVAIGQQPNPLLLRDTPEIKVNKWGNMIVDKHEMTTLPGVFAAGDIVHGAATVAKAMGAAKRAATSILSYLSAQS
eukprot:GCRY01005001.1.p1 GENE.GCRY01005001.1~~GCRY01005001.1.p1  ORF type:complete len:284 (-),score=107.34 GCRY01005001.1:625-1476(-)